MALDVSALGEGFYKFITALVTIVMAGVFVGATLFVANLWKKWSQYTCRILEKDGFGHTQMTTDKAGIFIDKKTGNKRFFLRKANVGLDADNIPYITQGRHRIVYILKTGLKNFRPITWKVNTDGVKNTVGEEDVNWALNAYDRQKKVFGQTLWQQIMPFLIIVVPTIGILIIFVYFFKSFDELITLGKILKEFAIEVARAKAGTVIIP